MRVVLGLAAFAVVVYLLLCGALFLYQRSLIYYPTPGSVAGNSATIALSTEVGPVFVSTRQYLGPDALVYFGGNSEDVTDSLPGLAAAFPEQAVFTLHYRGYSGSAGQPTQAALFADALALFDLVHARHANILVIGRSLGSGVAVYVASQRPVARLILVTPFDSIAEMAARQFPYFPVRRLLRDKFESFRYAPEVTAPTLVIAAERDEVIPRASTDALVSHFRAGVATFRLIAGAAHNTVAQSPEYFPLLKSVLSN